MHLGVIYCLNRQIGVSLKKVGAIIIAEHYHYSPVINIGRLPLPPAPPPPPQARLAANAFSHISQPTKCFLPVNK